MKGFKVQTKDVEKASKPAEISNLFRCSNEEKTRIQTENELKAYYTLRQELAEEGIIDPDE